MAEMFEFAADKFVIPASDYGDDIAVSRGESGSVCLTAHKEDGIRHLIFEPDQFAQLFMVVHPDRQQVAQHIVATMKEEGAITAHPFMLVLCTLGALAIIAVPAFLLGAYLF